MNLTEEQLEAVERRDGPLMVRAGAGTGKTTVLVERFVRAVVDDAVPVESMLAITFTDKAAAEMRTRVRRRLLELGRREEARAAESASISTIHGFCGRLLRAHALRAGIDPDYRLLEELEAERLAVDAFDRALEDFLGVTADADQPEHDPDRLEMVASYTPDSLRDMVRAAHAKLRSRGERRPALQPSVLPEPAGERERLEPAARAALAELSAGPSGVQVARAIERLQRCLGVLEGLAPGALAEPAVLGKLGAHRQRQGALHPRVRGVRRGGHGLLRAVRGPARAPRPRAPAPAARLLHRALRGGQARALGARLRGPPAARARPARGRCRAARALCDPLRARAGGRVPGREPAAERADRADRPREPLPRGRREPVDLRLPLRRRVGVPQPPRAGRGRGPRGQHHRELQDARRGAGRHRPRLRAHLRRELRAAPRGSRRARRRAPGTRPWRCSRCTGTRGPGRRPWPRARSGPPWRACPAGGRSRRACWPSASTS